MPFSLGFLVTFVRRLTGACAGQPAADFHVPTRTVVAHFHYVLFGTIVFPPSPDLLLFPKMTGRMMDETLGKIHFWTLFIGFHTTSWCSTGWATRACRAGTSTTCRPTDHHLNAISIGAFILGLSMLSFLWNVFKSYRFGRVVTVDDPASVTR